MKQTSKFSIFTLFLSVLSAPLFLLVSGCAIFGVVASAVPKPLQIAKADLAGQSVAVMVWADRGLRIDWPMAQRDLAVGVQNGLVEQQTKKQKSLLDAKFPVSADSVIKWQLDNPAYQAEPIERIAPRLNTTRFIYIELTDLATRADRSIALYRGSAKANLKVIEINNAVGSIVYEENNIEVKFPPKIGDEGIPTGGDLQFYRGTSAALSEAIVKRFIDWRED